MSAAPAIRVLLTEDVAADAELELRELKRAGLRVAHRIVQTEQSFEQALREFAPDVILSDFSMPGFDGMAALAIARDLAPDTPFIFVSGTIGEEYAIRAMKSGATDYVLKSNLLRLPAAVERALAEAAERRERRRTEVELEIARGRLTSIFNALPDVLWSVDARTRRYIYVSPAARTTFGVEAETLVGDPHLRAELVHEHDRSLVAEAWSRLQPDGEFDIDYRIVRPDGEVRWINNRARLIRSAQGVAERVDGLARDITEQVRHRQRIARLSRIRDLTSAINSALVRLRERQALFDEVCRIAVDVGQFIGAHVGLLDVQGRLEWVGRRGTSVMHLSTAAASVAADEQRRTIGARALATAKPAVWNDVARDADIPARERFVRHGIAAAGAFPLLVEGKVIGLLGLHAAEPGFFDQEEIRMLEEVAANVSFALELISKQDRITYLALYDPLTGLPNRALFHERLTQALERTRQDDETLALVLIDLERFKAINDTLGQQAGDRVLQALAKRLEQAAADLNRVARLGANLFAVWLQPISGPEEAGRRIELATQKLFAAPFAVDAKEVRLAAKAGVAVFPADGSDADALLRNAEAALERAKETGERYLFYAPEINARVSEQVELEHRLRKAVEAGELFLHFQPKFNLATRKIVGVEALMRWKSPDGGLVSPAKFVPVLEQTGLILEAGKQVIEGARRAYDSWKARGLNAPRIAVNVSALQLRRKSFVEDVREALGGAADDGGGVDLEVTESLLMTEVDESIRKLRELREMGLRVSLDDFGTGYSSLAYLSRLPLDTLKIDRSFVHGMTDNPDATSIIATIISLAQGLRLKVVAEGVETEEQAQLLRLLRCDQVQGFLFSPPVPAERLETLL